MQAEKNDTAENQRLDKWLKISCLYKTRSQATKACEERRVKVNGEVAKPHKFIHVGDRLTIRRSGGKYIDLTIDRLSRKNLAKKEARSLYSVDEPVVSDEARTLFDMFNKASKDMKPKYKGRPTKKERRKLEKVQKRYSPWD